MSDAYAAPDPSRPRAESHRPRRGLVLGAGGALGFTWALGALSAVEEVLDWRVSEADVIVGTSAGSIMGGLLALGYDVPTILRHQTGERCPDDPPIDWDYDADVGGVLPPAPLPGLGSPRLLLTAMRNPRRLPPVAALSALLPRGRGSLAPVGRMIELATTEAGQGPWPDQECWIVALDYDSGRRTVFGRPGSPAATLPQAVMASCSIPGWYRPVSFGGRRYVDGGTCSSASVDLLAGSGLDEVIVVAPMVSVELDRPRSPVARVERRVRRAITKRTLMEIQRVEAMGTKVTLLCPGEDDLVAIGANLMDHRRRDVVLATSLRTQRAAVRRSVATG